MMVQSALPPYQMLSPNSVVCLMSPTASGKTDLAFELYQTGRFELISVDSALIYQGMDIGTAKPTADELAKSVLPLAVKDIIDSFDHAITFWDKDDPSYIQACKDFSARWVSLPVSPSAEQFSRVIFFWVNEILKQTQMQNGEADVSVYSVIVHETATGYAQCFSEDVANEQMGKLELADFEFSEQVRAEWSDPQMYDKLVRGEKFYNPQVSLQVK